MYTTLATTGRVAVVYEGRSAREASLLGFLRAESQSLTVQSATHQVYIEALQEDTNAVNLGVFAVSTGTTCGQLSVPRSAASSSNVLPCPFQVGLRHTKALVCGGSLCRECWQYQL